MPSEVQRTSKPWLPAVAVTLWLVFLAATLWRLAARSQEPPLYDALGYFLKGKNFWDQLLQQHVFDPNVWPVYRPPGTILMSFPFGYDGLEGFHFRAVFLPIVLAAIAGWIVLRGSPARRRSAALSAALLLGLTSLPLFYELEPSHVLAAYVTWGHVDTFYAGIAALAAAASLRSLEMRSIGWLVFSAVIAALSIWVKPAGLTVMGSVGAMWFAASLSRVLVADGDRELRDRELAYLVKGTALTAILYATSTAGAFFGGYLSAEVVSYFTTAVKFIGALAVPWSMESAARVVATTLGYPYAALCAAAIAAAVAFAFRVARRKIWLDDAAVVGAICGAGYLVLGLAWWIVATEGILIRYIFPFLLMFAVALLPGIEAAAQRHGRVVHALVLILCLGSAANLAALLVTPAPSLEWQSRSGVNLSAGVWNGEVATAREFVATKTRERSAPTIYVVDYYPGAYIFENEVAFKATLDPTVSKIRFQRPIDWLRTSAFRFGEFLSSDYLLVTPVRGQALPKDGAALDTFMKEEQAVRIWVSTLGESDGVRVATDLPYMLLLKVTDRAAFAKATAAFYKRYAWRAETVAANKAEQFEAEADRSEWWNEAAVADYAKELAAKSIDFGDLYRVHALAIRRVGSAIKVEVWWEELRHEAANNQRYLFLHLLDKSGNLVHNQQIALDAYAPPGADRRWRYSVETFTDVLPNANLASLAMGIYRPDVKGGDLIAANSGTRDWDNRRVIVKLP